MINRKIENEIKKKFSAAGIFPSPEEALSIEKYLIENNIFLKK